MGSRCGFRQPPDARAPGVACAPLVEDPKRVGKKSC